MSELSGIFDTLGQTVMPEITSLVFPDTMDVVGETLAAGPAGGRIKSAATAVYSGVPVAYSPITKHSGHDTINAKMLSQKRYLLKFATHLAGNRIDIDPVNHRLKVLARGNEPEKVFRIVAVGDKAGVVFEIECIKEN